MGSRQPVTLPSSTNEFNDPTRIVAPARLSVQKRVDLGYVQPHSITRGFSNFSSAPFSQQTFGANNLFGSRKDNGGPTRSTFGDAQTTGETLGACGFSKLKTQAANSFGQDAFTFASDANSKSNPGIYRFLATDSSSGTTEASGLAAQFPVASSSQNKNIFEPAPSTTSKSLLKYTSPFTFTAASKKYNSNVRSRRPHSWVFLGGSATTVPTNDTAIENVNVATLVATPNDTSRNVVVKLETDSPEREHS